MATTTIKSTYSLDVETVRALERMARRWKVSKSEALRRAIRALASQELDGPDDDPVRALDRLQQSLGLSPDACRRWEKLVCDERSASSERREDRTG
jgi:hypothetical protein